MDGFFQVFGPWCRATKALNAEGRGGRVVPLDLVGWGESGGRVVPSQPTKASGERVGWEAAHGELQPLRCRTRSMGRVVEVWVVRSARRLGTTL